MIILNYAVETGIVSLAQPATIKAGFDVPVVINFDVAPGSISSIQFALVTSASVPQVLAYTEAFTAVNSTQWTALLDASDTRLIAAMAGMAADTVNAELAMILDGEQICGPNLSVTVQATALTGPAASEGGPTYYTQAQVNSQIAAAIAAIGLNATGTLAITVAGDALCSFAGTARNFIGNCTVAEGSRAYTAQLVLQAGNRVAGDRIDLQISVPASANPTVEIYDTTDSGTLLDTITGDPATARVYLLTAYFTGAAWVIFALTQQI